ncbi:MAG TPA: 30S ribosomal protein S2, partial [Nitrospiria bacterium]|nr:30S ribosomal protein S2 [Nitrospiria bacterium]
LGGMLTNFQTIRKNIDRMKKLEAGETDGTFDRLTKKEVAGLKKDRMKLEKFLAGIKDMTELPGAVFIVDSKKEHIAVREAQRLKIPIIAILDSNCDPDDADWIIPGNDDALRGIRLITNRLADAVLEGLELRAKNQPQPDAKPEAPEAGTAQDSKAEDAEPSPPPAETPAAEAAPEAVEGR